MAVEIVWINEYEEEVTEFEAYAMYDDMLNECYEWPKVGYTVVEPSRFLSEFDPVAYRCGFNDWIDSMGWEER